MVPLRVYREKSKERCKVPNFTEGKTDRAYESFMRHVPNFSRDPPEAKTIQRDIDNCQKQKGEVPHDKSE